MIRRFVFPVLINLSYTVVYISFKYMFVCNVYIDVDGFVWKWGVPKPSGFLSSYFLSNGYSWGDIQQHASVCVWVSNIYIYTHCLLQTYLDILVYKISIYSSHHLIKLNWGHCGINFYCEPPFQCGHRVTVVTIHSDLDMYIYIHTYIHLYVWTTNHQYRYTQSQQYKYTKHT